MTLSVYAWLATTSVSWIVFLKMYVNQAALEISNENFIDSYEQLTTGATKVSVGEISCGTEVPHMFLNCTRSRLEDFSCCFILSLLFLGLLAVGKNSSFKISLLN